MRARARASRKRIALAVLCVGLAAQASSTTVCDQDPNAVFFEATVDPTALNDFLARVGDLEIDVGTAPLVIPGLCTDHQINIATGFLSLPVDQAPFTVTPSLGSIRVDLSVPGPFQVGIDGGSYQRVNCSSTCVIDIPYLGEIFNGCSIEAGIVGPILRGLNASVGFDDLTVSQRADTCVLGDCTAVHPIETTTANLLGFDVDLTGFGSCEIFLDFPEPLPDLGPFDPCDGIDPLIELLLEPEIEDGIEDAFVNRQGEGTLVNVFSRQIVKDGCADIPEVAECKQGGTTIAGMLRGPSNPALNAALYLLPLGLVGGLAFRARRRRG